MKTYLTKNQKLAVDKLKKVKVAALFMEPGTGKTRTVIELIKELDYDNIVWFTPCYTKENLSKEINKWSDLKVNIIGIESISMSDRIYSDVLSIINEKSIVIVDESSKIKNISAKRTKRIIQASKNSKYRFVLNGTPIPKNYLDLWAQMEFLSPKILNMNYDQYKNTFCEITKITGKIGKNKINKEWISDYVNLDHLYKLIEPFVYDCNLEINKKKKYISKDVYLEDTEEYEKIKDKLLTNFIDEISFIKITQLLRQSISLDINKIKATEEIIKKEGQCLIFCCYIKTKLELQKKFPHCKVLIYKSGAMGLNLQEYNVIIFFDKTFNYLEREQAEHRIYRTGQKKDCKYYDLDVNVGLDTIIKNNIDKKVTMNEYFKTLLQRGIKIEKVL